MNITWQEGDLNYDGQVTISDFIDLASNFNTSYSGGAFPISAGDQKTPADFSQAFSRQGKPAPRTARGRIDHRRLHAHPPGSLASAGRPG